MRKIIIKSKLKFVIETCGSLVDKIQQDYVTVSSPLPDHMALECIEVLTEIKSQASSWINTDLDCLDIEDYASVCDAIFHRFNKIMNRIFPYERIEI